jgi:hypothetical protein
VRRHDFSFGISLFWSSAKSPEKQNQEGNQRADKSKLIVPFAAMPRGRARIDDAKRLTGELRG